MARAGFLLPAAGGQCASHRPPAGLPLASILRAILRREFAIVYARKNGTNGNGRAKGTKRTSGRNGETNHNERDRNERRNARKECTGRAIGPLIARPFAALPASCRPERTELPAGTDEERACPRAFRAALSVNGRSFRVASIAA
jgi:hypothetical protein